MDHGVGKTRKGVPIEIVVTPGDGGASAHTRAKDSARTHDRFLDSVKVIFERGDRFRPEAWIPFHGPTLEQALIRPPRCVETYRPHRDPPILSSYCCHTCLTDHVAVTIGVSITLVMEPEGNVGQPAGPANQ